MPRMNNNRRRNGSAPYKRMVPGGNLLKDRLDTLIDVQETQIRGMRPEVRDVPRQLVNRRAIYQMAKSFTAAAITGSNSVAISGAIVFQLSNLNDASALSDIFDQYRIVQAIVAFMPVGNTLNAPPLYTAIDYDDNNAPSITDIVQYSTLEVTPSPQTVERVVNPHIAMAAYSGAFTSFANAYGQWIDAASPSVQHYGVKYLIPTLPSGTQLAYTVVVTQIMQFRSVH